MNRHQELIAHLSPWMISTISEQLKTIEVLDEIWDDLPALIYSPAEGTIPVEMRRPDNLPALLANAREYLTSTATLEEAQMAVGVLGQSIKWPGTIGDPDAHLTIITRRVLGRYSCAVLFGAVFLLIDEQAWVPGVKEVLDACQRVSRRLGAMIQLLELPLREQYIVAYQIEMHVREANRMASQLYQDLRRKDRAIAAAYRRTNSDK